MNNIILCADDYGQNAAISQGIINLIQAKRLSATSCLTTAQEWPNFALLLLSYQNQVDIGLHFNLTDGKPLTNANAFQSLPSLLIKSQCRQLNKKIIATEFHAQLDYFIETLGQAPDFIDGHQHIHQFPVIRDVILEIYDTRLRQHHSYIRSTYLLKPFASLKHTIIQLSGAYHFKRQLQTYNIPHNTSFSGIYDFRHAKNYAQIFRQFLQEITKGGLIMCHPGLADPEDTTDPIRHARIAEYEFFMSEEFSKLNIPLHHVTINKTRIPTH